MELISCIPHMRFAGELYFPNRRRYFSKSAGLSGGKNFKKRTFSFPIFTDRSP